MRLWPISSIPGYIHFSVKSTIRRAQRRAHRWRGVVRARFSRVRPPKVAAIAVSIVLLHLILPLVPGLPAHRTAGGDELSQLSATLTQLWAVLGAVFDAALVALFFAYTAVQSAEPSLAALRALI